MTAGPVMLSRLAAIEPSELVRRHPDLIDKAGEIVADEGAVIVERGPGRAIYQVVGDSGIYTVRLDLTVYVWSGSCSHYAERGVPQQRRAPMCSHVLAAAYAEAQHLGLDIPDPRTAPPQPMATVTSIALGSRKAEPRDPAEAARLARGVNPMDGFYD